MSPSLSPRLMPEDFYHDATQEFSEFIRSSLRQGSLGSWHRTKDNLLLCRYLPASALARVWSVDGDVKVRRLLEAILGKRHPFIRKRTITTIRNEYTKVFSILLLIRKGPAIEDMLRNGLGDERLPFRQRPYNFPDLSGSDFFTDFYSQQWTFCVEDLRVHPFRIRSTPEILPFRYGERLGAGVSTVYMIMVDPEYNHLRAANGDSQNNSNNIFALKESNHKDEQQCRTEAENSERLREALRQNQNIVKFYGAYKHGLSCNIILEYADAGTLERFLMDTPPPSSAEEIHSFWSSILQLINALQGLHHIDNIKFPDESYVAWHNDVTPVNILVCRREGRSVYESSFKLADLGLCHVRLREQGHTTAPLPLGTRTYGAPDAYRRITESPLKGESNVDNFSLGAILIECLTWIVQGYQGVESFRRQREDAVRVIGSVENLDCFHDGVDVLPVVTDHCSSMVAQLLQLHPEDGLTPKIFEILVPHMVCHEAVRIDSRDLSRIMARLLSKHKLVIPSTRPITQPTARSFNGTSGISPEAESAPSWNMSPQEPMIDQRSSLASTAGSKGNDIFQSPESSPINNTVGFGRRLDAVAMMQNIPDSTNPPENTITYAAPRHDRTRGRQSDTTSQRTHQPTQAGRRYTLPAEERELPPWGLTHSDVQRRNGHTTYHSSQPHRETAEDESSQQLENTQSSPLTPPNANASAVPQYRPRSPRPNWTVREALSWRENRKRHRGNPVKLPHCDKLDYELDKRDIAFVFDNSPSMFEHWDDLCPFAEFLAYVCKRYDKNGLELSFTNTPGKFKADTATRLEELVRKNPPKRPEGLASQPASFSNPTPRLEDIIRPYQTELKQAFAAETPSKGPFRARTLKKRTIYVLTTGLFQPGSNPDGIIRSLCHTLVGLQVPIDQIGIQFIQFGNDPDGTAALNVLDNELKEWDSVQKLHRDIVDMEPYTGGNVLKMLLGPTNKWYDEDNIVSSHMSSPVPNDVMEAPSSQPTMSNIGPAACEVDPQQTPTRIPLRGGHQPHYYP